MIFILGIRAIVLAKMRFGWSTKMIIYMNLVSMLGLLVAALMPYLKKDSIEEKEYWREFSHFFQAIWILFVLIVDTETMLRFKRTQVQL